MAFPNVLRIAKNHYKDLRSASAGTVVVDEWKDEQGQPIIFHVFRLSTDDKEAINEARRNYGDSGAHCMLVARACYLVDGLEKKRAFTDTDFEAMRTQIDLDVLLSISDRVKVILGA